MLRKLIQFTIIFLASLTILACDSENQTVVIENLNVKGMIKNHKMVAGLSPNEVLSNYLDASLKGRYEESYSYVSADDKAVKDLQSYLKENEKTDNPFAQAIASKVSYKILKIEKSDKKATADVEITLPDFESISADIRADAAFKSAVGSGDKKEMERIMRKKLESDKVPLTTRKETFKNYLVKEEGGWKVFLDWKTEKIKRERQAKIQTLLAEAKDLKKSMKLHGAAQKYEQVLELDSKMVDAKKGLEKTKKEIKKQAYIKNVVLYNLKAKYYKTYLEEKVPGVEFKIKNKGNRTLKEVEVTVYFKDASGTIIAEKTYHPVLVSKYSFSRDNKPLKPNYIWQKGKGKFYKADSVPTEWKEGAVSAKITNIEFAK
jgi:hypothetical protein